MIAESTQLEAPGDRRERVRLAVGGGDDGGRGLRGSWMVRRSSRSRPTTRSVRGGASGGGADELADEEGEVRGGAGEDEEQRGDDTQRRGVGGGCRGNP